MEACRQNVMKTVIFGYDHVGSITMHEPIHPEILDLSKNEDFRSAILGDATQIVSEPSLLRSPPSTVRLSLVIDLDETMVRAHASCLEIAIRPGAVDLLKFLSEHKEIDPIFWTASMEVHAIRCVAALFVALERVYPGTKLSYSIVYRGLWTLDKVKDVYLLEGRFPNVLLIDNNPDSISDPSKALLVESYELQSVHHREQTSGVSPLVIVQSLCQILLAQESPKCDVPKGLASKEASEMGIYCSGGLFSAMYILCAHCKGPSISPTVCLIEGSGTRTVMRCHPLLALPIDYSCCLVEAYG